MKLTDVQKYQIQEAYEKSRVVLNQIKRKSLQGKDLDNMKILESAVSNLETILIICH